ncbi:MAG TPA: family 20 glycosylhydrolase [Sediminibacterium sp.]|nr:family 20 glycosylhydrolase [Sediminibacterium sp.]
MRIFYSYFLALLIATNAMGQQSIRIIPQPVKLTEGQGFFLIDSHTSLSYAEKDKGLRDAALFLCEAVKSIAGINIRQPHTSAKHIQLMIKKIADIGEEGYQMRVTEKSITISAATKAGMIYGIQTLLQTLPAVRTNAALLVPCMEITDYPRFRWRGMHLDVSRHFFSPDIIREYIDLMARYKMNVFHWHLTDDQGWRIEIKKYPELTKTGAWRVDQTDKVWGERPQAKEGEPATYGGFYTQEQIKEIVAYAAQRNVTIVPEIEMPGHSAAAIAAYPQLSCTKRKQLPLTGGDYTNASSVYCAGNDSVFTFLQNVLTEVMALFPSAYIHVGGDEVDKTQWKNCPVCQARMKKEGLQNEEELQSYFMKRIERFIIAHHRKMIGWDEILEGGLAPEAAVMSWRGEAGGIAAAKMGHKVVMTPGAPCYFDHYQAGPEGEPLAIGGMNTLKRVYDYEPVPHELNADQAKYVMGAQANLWTEFVKTAEHVEYMVLPRMLALAEVVWSPPATRNWADFYQRLQPSFRYFDQKGLHYSKGNFTVSFTPKTVNGEIEAELSNEMPGTTIRYTTDGSNPDNHSLLYTGPVPIHSSQVLKAISVCNGTVMSVTPAQQQFVVHKASGKTVSYSNPASTYYPADGPNTLTDGIRGSLALNKHWHGFSGKDMVAVIDLQKATSFGRVSLGCLQRYRDWVFLPQSVTVEVSSDGISYRKAGEIQNEIPATEKAPLIRDFTVQFPEIKARYIRVTAKIIDACPPGHPGAGKPGWLFSDELMVE